MPHALTGSAALMRLDRTRVFRLAHRRPRATRVRDNREDAKILRRITVFQVLSAIIALCSFIFIAQTDLRKTENAEYASNVTLARTLEALTTTTLQQSEQSARSIVSGLTSIDGLRSTSPEDVEQTLVQAMRFDQVSDFLFARSGGALTVVDRAGKVLRAPAALVEISAGISDAETRGFGLGATFRVSGTSSFYIPLIVSDGAESHAKVVAGALVDANRLIQPYARITRNNGISAALVSFEDELLLHIPDPEYYVGAVGMHRAILNEWRRLGKGGVLFSGQTTGTPSELVAFQPSERFRLLAIVSSSKDGYLSQSYLRTLLTGALLLLAFICIYVFGQRLRTNARELIYQTNHDTLTGLQNRSWFMERLTALTSLKRVDSFAVVLINLNHFKEMNASFGFAVGDELLREVATRLHMLVEASDATLARLGADEFAILVDSASLPASVEGFVAQLLNELSRPTAVDGPPIILRARAGIATWPDDGQDKRLLLKAADIAMQHAKRRPNSIATYGSVGDRATFGRASLYSRLDEALRMATGLHLEYQPKISIANQKLVGLEALLRWTLPDGTSISPAEFIPLAEQTELIHALTNWVVNEALSQMSLWAESGFVVPVAINVSVSNLQSDEFVRMLTNALKRYKVHASLIEIEITEGAVMEQPEAVLTRMQTIKDAGIAISVDDFGTGYSSLSYLKRLPVDSLKIDRSFLEHLVSSDADQTIVASIIDLAHRFGLQVIAEGVESQDVINILKSYRCDVAQGYHFSRPMPASEVPAWANIRSAEEASAGVTH